MDNCTLPGGKGNCDSAVNQTVPIDQLGATKSWHSV